MASAALLSICITSETNSFTSYFRVSSVSALSSWILADALIEHITSSILHTLLSTARTSEFNEIKSYLNSSTDLLTFESERTSD